jgi:hypothetical protein
VELSGSGEAVALQKAVLIAGNTQGVGEVGVAAGQTAVDDGT